MLTSVLCGGVVTPFGLVESFTCLACRAEMCDCSIHSWIGVTVYVLSWCQFLCGLFIFWLPGFAPRSVKAAYLRYHKVGGLAIYSGALAAIASGLMQKQSFLRNNSPKAPLFGAANLMANALGVAVVLTFFAVLAVLGFESVSPSHVPISERGSRSVSPQNGDSGASASATDTELLRPRSPTRRGSSTCIASLQLRSEILTAFPRAGDLEASVEAPDASCSGEITCLAICARVELQLW
ncbi:hypothetical protein, conserved [Eimeria brunetti]|uniref:Cytochrome b561 domain-containing protein n=1 Tax=Eimeria brunetti TaxID=51314 RepID=U6LUG1_9EIME|nr:hypothetical protein, conserved [Eimeria brunetti]